MKRKAIQDVVDMKIRLLETKLFVGTLDAFTFIFCRLQVFDEDKLGRNSFIGETCVALKVFHSKPSQTLKRSLISRAYVSTNLLNTLYTHKMF